MLKETSDLSYSLSIIHRFCRRYAFEQQPPILGPSKHPSPKHLPACWYESRSAVQLSGGGENGVDGRTTARQGSCFGPSPDEPAFQLRQLRPPRESDAFEIVFGWPPVLEGKLWPRAEVINPRCFGNSCQPQTPVSCCSGDLRPPTALIERRYSLVSFGGSRPPTPDPGPPLIERHYSLVSLRGRDRKAGKDHQAVAARQVLQGVHLLAPPATQHSPPAKEKGNIGTEARRQLETRRRVQAVPGEAFESQDRRCGVAASTPEAASNRNPLLQSNLDGAPEFARPLPEPAGLMDQVPWARRDGSVIAHDPDVLTCPASSPAGGSPQQNLQAVVQRHRLIDSQDFVVAVRPLAKDFQTQVDLGEGADSDGVNRRCQR